MRWRLVFAGILAPLIVLVGEFGFTGSVGAAPKVVFGPPRIVQKATLPETSIDGPALWTPNIVSNEPGGGPGVVLAWTGTDAAHHLNTMIGGFNLAFASKHTYNETSFVGPAVTTVVDGGIALAWTGTNAGRSLNVLCSNCGSTSGLRKLTLQQDSSFTSPAIAFSGGKLWLAWAGTDANHSLNVLPIDFNTLSPGTKVVLRQFSSVAGPSLRPDPNTKGLIMSWAGTSPLERIRFATSADGVRWTQPPASPLGELTAAHPSILALAISNTPNYWLGWTGTDPRHSVNVRYTEGFPNWPLDNAKTTFNEQALGGPALANGSDTSPDGTTRRVLLGWTGTDRLHHLNVALVAV